jgi:NAD(P)-dependent dehydrogenase (short-subunit alcohol dehydrogenase family)
MRNSRPDSGFTALDLSGRSIVVTGAASGIGRATAHLCAARGASVMLADRDEALLSEATAAIVSAGGHAGQVVTDVTVEGDVVAMIDTVVGEFGRLDGAFNCAGITGGPAGIAEMSLADWDRVIAVNLTATFLCLTYELLHLLAHGGGSIVNAASRASVVAPPRLPAYTASKRGVMGLTRSASADYARHGVRINAVLPGVIVTPMTDMALHDPALAVARAGAHPIGRFGQANEVAELVAWLLSDASSFSTGSAFFIDGGANGV